MTGTNNNIPPTPLIALRKPGWIELGTSRICVLEGLGGYHSLREQIAQEVGADSEADICQRAGFASAERLITAGLSGGQLTPDAAGFRQAVSLFGSAGYGSFEVQEVRFNEGWARVTSRDSFEGWVYREQGTRTGTACDMTRGMMAGIMYFLRSASGEETLEEAGIDPIGCVETNCIANGEETCTFVVGTISRLLSEGLRPAETAQNSVRETLLRLNRQLEEILDSSRKDALTNLYNRSYFEAVLRQRIGFAKRRSDVISLAVIDIDHFKVVNDTHGHTAGDRALRSLARILEAQARDNDIVARLGGDEFVWLMPATPASSAVAVAQRIRHHLEDMKDELGFALSISVGIANYPKDALTPGALLESADRALYSAKNAGRNRIALFDAGAGESEAQMIHPEPAPAGPAPSQAQVPTTANDKAAAHTAAEEAEPVHKAPPMVARPGLRRAPRYRKVR
ncbi:MAG TPA: diguanylate cyclase [Capsulimonadaceae bacterium]|nr:diguanylate cyclase [Capsulimonadaceae bacterium]